jgi:hypothetical protein
LSTHGVSVVGESDGLDVGLADGDNVGESEGLNVGLADGFNVGLADGLNVGESEGPLKQSEALFPYFIMLYTCLVICF